MTTTIRFADGRTPITCASPAEADARLRALYPDGVSESDGTRTLWWETAEDAEDDAGARAVAEYAARSWRVSDDCGGAWPTPVTAADAESALDAAEAQVRRAQADYADAKTVRITVADDEGSHSREVSL